MIYKTEQIAKDYKYYVTENEYHLQLREYLDVLDRISIMTGHGELTMTDFLRDGDKWLTSLHHKSYSGRAVDLRVRDKPVIWYVVMTMIGKAIEMLNPKFRMNAHPELYNKPSKHIHIEIRS